MNIFEFLDLPADHRKAETTQLVKHWDEVVEKNKAGKLFALQKKKDGVCALTVIWAGKIGIFSRTGKRFSSTARLERDIKAMNMRDGVYMGEMCCKLVSLEKMSGVTSPNRVNPLDEDGMHVARNLEMWFFDIVSINSFKEGASQTKFPVRFKILLERVMAGITAGPNCNIHVIHYTLCSCEDLIREHAQELIDAGEEGLIIRDVEADWVAGHKGYRVMKIIRGVSYDLLCIGWLEGKGKCLRQIGNLLFKWKDGKTIKAPLGKGWTYSDAAQMYIDVNNKTVDSPIGKIFDVYALQESSKGKLRNVKTGELRHDKVVADV